MYDLKARVKVNSHTNYKWLSSRELRQRLQALHSNTRSLSRKYDRLINRVMAATEARGVPVDVDLHTNLVQIMSHRAADILQDHCPGSFGRVFWEAQQRAASLSDSRSMRWDPLMIMWCIYLHDLSSTAHETLRRSGIVHLPSQWTLRDYTHHIPAKSGWAGCKQAAVSNPLGLQYTKPEIHIPFFFSDPMKTVRNAWASQKRHLWVSFSLP